jgi:hypothetical protein
MSNFMRSAIGTGAIETAEKVEFATTVELLPNASEITPLRSL